MRRERVRDLLPEYLLGSLEDREAADVEAALAASPELRHEAESLAHALFALPEELDPAPLADDAWSRLHTTVATGAGTANTVARPPRDRLRGFALALAAGLALLVAAGAWGWTAVQENADLADEQRIIAYWMRNPNLAIVALDGVGAGATPVGAEAAEIPPGVVCILPDGRAMLLQPYAPPSGSRYVLYGRSALGLVRLGNTDDRFLLFDAEELAGVELALEGRRSGVVAEAAF